MQKGNTPLHVVCEKGHTETAQLLIDRGADLHKCNKVHVYTYVTKINGPMLTKCNHDYVV